MLARKGKETNRRRGPLFPAEGEEVEEVVRDDPPVSDTTRWELLRKDGGKVVLEMPRRLMCWD